MEDYTNVLNCGLATAADSAVAIPVERFEELIKKEALLDKLMENKAVSVYLYQPVKEGLNA